MNNSENFNCLSRGICSSPLRTRSIEMLSLNILSQISFYLIELENIDFSKTEMRRIVFEHLYILNNLSLYDNNQLLKFINDEISNLLKIKNLYIDCCNKNNMECKSSNNIELSNTFKNINAAINYGDKILLKYKETETLIINIALIKLCARYYCKRYKRSMFYKKTGNYLLNILACSFFKINNNDCNVKTTKILSRIYRLLAFKLVKKYIKKYGPIEKKEVPLSTQKGQAILVAGDDIDTLFELLDALNQSEIDIYTLDTLGLIFSLKKSKAYNNLKGIYKNNDTNNIVDFSTFPGPILLTKYSKIFDNSIIRGDIYILDKFMPKGFTKINNTNFDLLIKKANEKGFKTGKTKDTEIIGFDYNNFTSIFQQLIKNKQYTKNKIYIFIATRNSTRFIFNLINKQPTKNTIIINFGEYINNKCIINLPVSKNNLLEFYIVSKLLNIHSLNANNLNFIFSRLEIHSIPLILYLKSKHFNNIFVNNDFSDEISPKSFLYFCKSLNIESFNKL